jgi:hypothetical protein
MKTKSLPIQSLLFIAGSLSLAAGCSTFKSSETAEAGKELAAIGPTVLNARSEPSTVELNRSLQPIKTPEILADVKDFRSKVTDVKLKFVHVPITVAMENIGGTTWRAELTPQQLQMLAVSGKTISYDANIVARNERGQTAVSTTPVTVAVKAPDLAQNTSG